ncbi:MAG TPA: FAD-dependent oxidoreductase [Thermoanaerobaculia bacterium]|nr:FAD-dependent oxidoreductase [Thermoanaerobaculia bacterium]
MNPELIRDPASAASRTWDLIVVGGGIQGVALTLEAARRGLAALLVERDDFGGATTWSSLRIVHGGMRYLQSLDLPRYRESVAERGWLLRHFPDLVAPLPCLMPLYAQPRGGRLRRRSTFRLALAANRFLSRHRNDGVQPDRHLPPGRLLGVEETLRIFPQVDRDGLRGAALWYDGVLTEPSRLVIEMLRWASACGARALNYVEANGLLLDGERVAGLRVVDRASGRHLELRAPVVVSCAGPWSRALAARFDRDLPELFRPVLGFNVLLDREPPSHCAVAVTARGANAKTWFITPFGWTRTLAGTRYLPAASDLGGGPREEDVAAFLAELAAALPGFGARSAPVVQVLWGWLPAVADGGTVPSSHPVVHDHGAAGGPAGLWSVSGVKLTTARSLAEQVLTRVLARRGQPLPALGTVARPPADPPPLLSHLLGLVSREPEIVRELLQEIAARQAVVRVEDLLWRRTDWGLLPEAGAAVRLCSVLEQREPLKVEARVGTGR